jgi:hypothetical protein
MESDGEAWGQWTTPALAADSGATRSLDWTPVESAKAVDLRLSPGQHGRHVVVAACS